MLIKHDARQIGINLLFYGPDSPEMAGVMAKIYSGLTAGVKADSRPSGPLPNSGKITPLMQVPWGRVQGYDVFLHLWTLTLRPDHHAVEINLGDALIFVPMHGQTHENPRVLKYAIKALSHYGKSDLRPYRLHWSPLEFATPDGWGDLIVDLNSAASIKQMIQSILPPTDTLQLEPATPASTPPVFAANSRAEMDGDVTERLLAAVGQEDRSRARQAAADLAEVFLRQRADIPEADFLAVAESLLTFEKRTGHQAADVFILRLAPYLSPAVFSRDSFWYPGFHAPAYLMRLLATRPAPPDQASDLYENLRRGSHPGRRSGDGTVERLAEDLISEPRYLDLLRELGYQRAFTFAWKRTASQAMAHFFGLLSLGNRESWLDEVTGHQGELDFADLVPRYLNEKPSEPTIIFGLVLVDQILQRKFTARQISRDKKKLVVNGVKTLLKGMAASELPVPTAFEDLPALFENLRSSLDGSPAPSASLRALYKLSLILGLDGADLHAAFVRNFPHEDLFEIRPNETIAFGM